MKRWLWLKITLAVSWIFIFSFPSHAFLTDSDPDNFFDLIEKAPWVAVATLEQTEAPTTEKRYFIYSLKIQKTLSGKELSEKIKVLQEQFFHNESGNLPSQQEILIFLAPLPNYTAYATVRASGVEYRLMSGKAGGIPLLPQSKSEVLALTQEMLNTKSLGTGKKEVFLKALKSADSRIKGDGALALGALNISKDFLSTEDISQILAAIPNVPPKAKMALVDSLQKNGDKPSIEALQKLADGPASAQKWAAIRSLEKLGIQRPTKTLTEDFNQASEDEKQNVLAFITKHQDKETQIFLTQLINGPSTLKVKNQAITEMVQNKNPPNEHILLAQLNQKDEDVLIMVVSALGIMQSKAAVPTFISLIDSPSPNLRYAAFVALRQSQDPRAASVMRQRFPGENDGHTD